MGAYWPLLLALALVAGAVGWLVWWVHRMEAKAALEMVDTPGSKWRNGPVAPDPVGMETPEAAHRRDLLKRAGYSDQVVGFLSDDWSIPTRVAVSAIQMCRQRFTNAADAEMNALYIIGILDELPVANAS